MKHSHLPSLFLAIGSLVACSRPPSAPPPAAPAPPPPAPAPTAGAGEPGRVVTEHFHSDALGVDKDVVIYLPAGYDNQPDKHWPVFYYLHGLGGNETNWVQNGKLDDAANRLGLAAIVVMPDGDDDFYIDSALPIDYSKCLADGTGLFIKKPPFEKACVHTRNYETYIAKDLVGWVDGHYHTLARRDGRAIAGLSMGGFGAMAIALRHPDEFAAAASHSGALAQMYLGPHPYVAGRANLTPFIADPGPAAGPIVQWIIQLSGTDIASWRAHDVVELASKLPPGKVALYFDCGTEDDFNLEDNLQYIHEALTDRHIDHAYFLGTGHHDFGFWVPRLPFSLGFLRDHTAKPE